MLVERVVKGGTYIHGELDGATVFKYGNFMDTVSLYCMKVKWMHEYNVYTAKATAYEL